jgi:hypothetical protein
LSINPKLLYSFFFFFGPTTITKAKAQDSLKNLEMAISYLSENKNFLAQKWLSVIQKNSKNFEKYKEILKNGLDFKVSDTFSIRSISYFKDSLEYYSKEVGADLFLENEYFMPYKDSNVEKLNSAKSINIDTSFTVGFSMPLNKFVICEIWYKDYGQNFKPKFGQSLIILFLFNKNSTIKSIHFRRIIR